MPAAVRMRTDFSASELRRLAATTKTANQSRRLLSLAAVLDGMSRSEAARIGGMDRQTLRDWVHRFNASGPEGLKDIPSTGHPPRLSPAQQAELAQLVETGPDRAVHGVVRWRRIDLKQLIAERFGVTYHERTVGKILHQLGFSHISARPRHRRASLCSPSSHPAGLGPTTVLNPDPRSSRRRHHSVRRSAMRPWSHSATVTPVPPPGPEPLRSGPVSGSPHAGLSALPSGTRP